MIGRLVAVTTFGVALVVLASLVQGAASSAAIGSIWLAVPLGVAVAAFLSFRAPTLKAAWGRLSLLDGLLWLAVVPTSLVLRASAMQEPYQPEIISDETARHAVSQALFSYLPMIAFWIGVILVVSSIVLLGSRHSKR